MRNAGFTQYLASMSKGWAALILAVTALAVFEAQDGKTGLAKSCNCVDVWLAGAGAASRTTTVGGAVLHLVNLATCSGLELK